jgi:gamma-glutamylcyclotransferase (GGCT)/AIG2-like uncharacterized protein YtfP
MTSRVFAYGTLLVPRVVEALLGREPPGRPASLQGFARGVVRGRSYPAMAARPGARTEGRVYEGITRRELGLLDRFEGERYLRRRVRVELDHGEMLPALTYVLRPRELHALIRRPWDVERFANRHLSVYEAQCTALRRGFRTGVR